MPRRRSIATFAFLLSFVALFFVVPFPYSIRAVAVTQVEPEQLHRLAVPTAGGLLKTLHVRDGQRVRKGDVLAVFHNPHLERRLRLTEADQALRAQQQKAYLGQMTLLFDSAVSGDSYEEIRHQQRALAEEHRFLKAQLNALTVRAPCDGVVLQLPSWESRGKWFTEGEPFLAVGQTDSLRGVLLLDAADRQLVIEGQAVRYLCRGSSPLTRGKVFEVAPAEAATIPPHLAGRVGGEVATTHDPLTKGEKPFKQHYLVTVRFDDAAPSHHPGVLGDACIEVGSATLWWRVRRFLGVTFHWEL